MGTLVCFHAHPDDESIATAGSMVAAAAGGHRVVLVVATLGEEGEVPDGFLADGESLAERREAETRASAQILGASRVEFLGYRDSGMVGTTTNDHPDAFCRADLDEAAGRLAAVLREEGADVVTIYDENGVYGHPDHVQVHRVGTRATELAGTPRVLESTMNRDYLRSLMAEAREADAELGAVDSPDVDEMQLGVPGDRITTRVDVTAHVGRKRASMRAHASQISEQSFFLAMPDEAFTRSFGYEWYIRHGVPVPVEGYEDSIFGEE
jgi:LmbE family N-acetylglucosaminyl deacetylase